MLRKMDVPDGELRGRQVVLLANGGRQSFRNGLCAGQGLAAEGGQKMVGDTSGEPIDGHDTASDVLFPDPLKDGIGHGAPAPLLLHGAVKDELLSCPQRFFHVALIKKGEVESAGVVHHLDLDQVKSTADAGQTGMLRHQGGDANPALQGGLPDGKDLAPVFVVSGIVGQKVFDLD